MIRSAGRCTAWPVKARLGKIGQGLYTRATPSLIDGRLRPVKGLRELAREALSRLGIEITEAPRNAPTILAGANRCRPVARWLSHGTRGAAVDMGGGQVSDPRHGNWRAAEALEKAATACLRLTICRNSDYD
jgi:hypothetical protein